MAPNNQPGLPHLPIARQFSTQGHRHADEKISYHNTTTQKREVTSKLLLSSSPRVSQPWDIYVTFRTCPSPDKRSIRNHFNTLSQDHDFLKQRFRCFQARSPENPSCKVSRFSEIIVAGKASPIMPNHRRCRDGYSRRHDRTFRSHS